MKWSFHPFTRPRKTGQTSPSGRCALTGCNSENWYRVDGGLVRQCDDCGTVTVVVSQRWREPPPLSSTDFEGCTE